MKCMHNIIIHHIQDMIPPPPDPLPTILRTFQTLCCFYNFFSLLQIILSDAENDKEVEVEMFSSPLKQDKLLPKTYGKKSLSAAQIDDKDNNRK